MILYPAIFINVAKTPAVSLQLVGPGHYVARPLQDNALASFRQAGVSGEQHDALITHKWLAALGLASSIAAFPAPAAKDGGGGRSNFTTLDPRDANGYTSSRSAVAKSFYQGCLARIKIHEGAKRPGGRLLYRFWMTGPEPANTQYLPHDRGEISDGADFDAAAVKARISIAPAIRDNHNSQAL